MLTEYASRLYLSATTSVSRRYVVRTSNSLKGSIRQASPSHDSCRIANPPSLPVYETSITLATLGGTLSFAQQEVAHNNTTCQTSRTKATSSSIAMD